jgi:hypothetical protein
MLFGKPLPDESIGREWESSISVYDDLDFVIALALRYPGLGAYIARIVVPDDGSVEFARTMKRRHHYSIYASADVIFDMVDGNPIPVPRGDIRG